MEKPGEIGECGGDRGGIAECEFGKNGENGDALRKLLPELMLRHHFIDSASRLFASTCVDRKMLI
jgi:hypothetical protein